MQTIISTERARLERCKDRGYRVTCLINRLNGEPIVSSFISSYDVAKTEFDRINRDIRVGDLVRLERFFVQDKKGGSFYPVGEIVEVNGSDITVIFSARVTGYSSDRVVEATLDDIKQFI